MKTINISKINKLELLFYPAWALYVATTMLDSTVIGMESNTIDLVYKIMRYVVYGMCFIKICSTAYTIQDIPFLLIFALAFFLGFYSGKNGTLVFYCLIMLSSYKMNNEKTIKITAYTQGIFLLLIILLSQTGIITDYVFDEDARHRYGLGFTWTTVAPITFFYFIMCFIYTNRRRIKWHHIIILEIINVWLYYKTNTRMAFALSSLFLLVVLFEKMNRKRFKILSKFKLVYIVYPFLAWLLVIIVCKVFNRDGSTWVRINTLLSGRLKLSQDAVRLYGIHLLGQKVEWKGTNIFHTTYAPGEYNYVDSSYLQLTISYGMIFMFVVLVLFAYAIYKHIKVNDYYTVLIYIFILTLTLTEPQLMNFAYNPFSLLAFGIASKNIRVSRYVRKYRRKWKLGTGAANEINYEQ